MLEEILSLQNELKNCVNEILDSSLDTKAELHKDLDKCLAQRAGLDKLLSQHIDQRFYATKEAQLSFADKVDSAYLTLGRLGYNARVCESL